jgi:hypothetical protein
MTAIEALELAHAEGVRVCLAGDFIRYRCAGTAPPDVLNALKAAKPEIVALLRRYTVDASGALIGDEVLDRLAKLGFCVRRYGDWCTVEDHAGVGLVPTNPSLLWEFCERQRSYAALLVTLDAPDQLGRKAQRADFIGRRNF